MAKAIIQEFDKASLAVKFLNKIRVSTDAEAVIDIKHENDERVYVVIYHK